MAFFKSGKVQEAIDDFSRVLELNPHHAMARYARAGCYNIVEKYNEAIEDYTIALQCDHASHRGGSRLYLHETAEKVIHGAIRTKSLEQSGKKQARKHVLSATPRVQIKLGRKAPKKVTIKL